MLSLDGLPKAGLQLRRVSLCLRDFFIVVLPMTWVRFVKDVLEAFSVQLHQLTPSGILALVKFYWASRTFNVGC